jgi:DNA primase
MIDTQSIIESTDLLALIQPDTHLKRVASSEGGEYAGPCPFCGGEDRFRVQPQARRWLCRGCTNGQWQDAIDFVEHRDRVGFLEACKRLSPDSVSRRKPSKPIVQEKASDGPPSEEWQNASILLAAECADRLWAGVDWITNNVGENWDDESLWTEAPKSARAFRWLTNRRGLTQDTIRSAMLGYNPEWDRGLPPGGTIPCIAGPDLSLWYIKVRGFQSSQPKYRFRMGSEAKALFGAESLLKCEYAVVVEGEFDALLLSQMAGDLVAVVTMGSAGSVPGAYWQRYFAFLKGAFVALDSDKAGQQGYEKWTKLVPWLKPMPQFEITESVRSRQEEIRLDHITDLTDYWLCGGDLRKWVQSALVVAK